MIYNQKLLNAKAALTEFSEGILKSLATRDVKNKSRILDLKEAIKEA
jgi:hypothetical protein